MVKVRATAVRWESDDFPGWIEVSVLDARHQEHRIVEKVPVLTLLTITADSTFPVELWIDAELDGVDGDDVGVSFAHGVETLDGARGITVSAADVQRPSAALERTATERVFSYGTLRQADVQRALFGRAVPPSTTCCLASGLMS